MATVQDTEPYEHYLSDLSWTPPPNAMPKNRRVAYYFDPDVGAFSYGYGHVMKPHRIKMTHSLVAAYDLLPKLDVLRPVKATAQQMTRFHTDEYINYLENMVPPLDLSDHNLNNPYLPGHDNPPYEGAFEFCSISAGGSICAGQRLGTGASDIAVNWAGGLHHAKKVGASGFCYINDIVLGILELLRTFPRVLYVDIDCHHGDAVEEAFYTTDRVFTCSLHKYGDFFPGTGVLDDRGAGPGYRYSLNVPFRHGTCDETFHSIFTPLMDKILARFQPSAVVLQCGADSLSGDRLGQYNLSMDGHAECTRYFRKSGLPLMVLGGGGYTIKNVARTWMYETACALGVDQDLSQDIPYNQYFEYFAPEWRLKVPTSNWEDANLLPASEKIGGEGQSVGSGKSYLEYIQETILRFADEIPIAPSVQMQTVPAHSLAEELGLPKIAAQASMSKQRRQQLEADGEDEIARLGYHPQYDEFDDRIQELAREFYATPSSSSDTEEEHDWDEDDARSELSRSRGSRINHPAPPSSSRLQYPFQRGTIPIGSPSPFQHPPPSSQQSGQPSRKKADVPKRRFFNNDIRFKGRGDVAYEMSFGVGRTDLRYMGGMCDPIAVDIGMTFDDDVIGTGMNTPRGVAEEEEGHEAEDEDDMEMDGSDAE